MTIVRTCIAALMLVAASAGAQAPREVHGSGDAYADSRIALAWAVLRGASEGATLVVVRIEAEPQPRRWIAVVGIDPFTKAEATLRPVTELEAPVEVRIPRARFGELPRTELRIFDAKPASPAEAPQRTIYYVGVPDTTPEFADESKLEADLAARIARARAAAAKEGR